MRNALSEIHVLWVMSADGETPVGWFFHPNEEALADKKRDLQDQGLIVEIKRYVLAEEPEKPEMSEALKQRLRALWPGQR